MTIFRVAALAAVAYGAACLVSQAFVAPRPVAARATRVARRALSVDEIPADLMEAGGPDIIYMKLLMDAAAKKGESVPVTKDVMKYKAMMEDLPPDMDDDLMMGFEGGVEDGCFDVSEVEKAALLVKKLGPWESTVFPKFITFLAKKVRLDQLLGISESYVSTLYVQQSIAPVVVTSAEPLSDDQLATIMTKMQKKIGVADIKLAARTDSTLLGGFKVEWGFLDPEHLDGAPYCIDLTLKEGFRRAALNGISATA